MRGVLRVVPLASGEEVAPAVTLDDVKLHLRVEHDADDDIIQTYINAATGHLDGVSGVLSRGLINRDYTYTIGTFPVGNCSVDLPLCGVSAIVSVSYFDGFGNSETLAPEAYSLVSDDAFTSRLSIAVDQDWPDTYRRSDAVTITFTSGFGDETVDVPAAIRTAIMMMVGDMYAFREAKVEGTVSANPTVDLLISNYRKPAIR